MSENKSDKKENLFAKLAMHQARATSEETAAAPEEVPVIPPPPSPAPAEPRPKTSTAKKKPEPAKGKRDNPDYCQANAYVPKRLRRAVDRVLLDMEDMDYSTLVTELLRKWLKSNGVSE